MSQQSSSYVSYSSSSYSSSSSANNGQPHTQTYSEQTSYDSERGGQHSRRHEETGQPTLEETTEIPAGGNRIQDSDTVRDTSRRIEDVTDKEELDQQERDRQYMERMEEEYAKREGGA